MSTSYQLFLHHAFLLLRRDVAQPGSARRSGRRGRWFESSHPDLTKATFSGALFRFMAYFTYILRSTKTDRLYFGQTEDLVKRLKEHNNGQTTSTSSGKPWEVIFFKAFETRSEAIALERLLKSWKNKQRILTWIERQKLGGL